MLRILLTALLLFGAAATAGAQCFPMPACTLVPPPATQVVAAGDTISANACGSTKPVSAAGAVSTSTVNTFSVPNGSNLGCIMSVCNVGTQTITLKTNTNFPGAGAADVSLTSEDCVVVGRVAAKWYQLSAVLSNN